MSTFFKIALLAISFSGLILFQIFNTKKEFEKHVKQQVDNLFISSPHNYLIISIIENIVFDILLVLLFIFIYPNYIFLYWNKIIITSLIILIYIFWCLCMHTNNNNKFDYKFFIYTSLIGIVFATIFIIVSLPSISVTTLETKETSYNITEIRNFFEYTDKTNVSNYIIDYSKNGKQKIEKIESKQVKVFENSDNLDIKKTTITYTKYDYELKDKQNATYTEVESYYYIFIPEDMVTKLD